MSRSFRAPWYVDGYKGSLRRRFFKRYSNRKIRRIKTEMPDGKAYRKIFDSWSIVDYRWLYDPKPYVYMYDGVQYIREPAPLWRVNRK